MDAGHHRSMVLCNVFGCIACQLRCPMSSDTARFQCNRHMRTSGSLHRHPPAICLPLCRRRAAPSAHSAAGPAGGGSSIEETLLRNTRKVRTAGEMKSAHP